MASPVSIGDAITLITQICHMYDTYKSTPEKLRQILRKFHDVEKELEALNKVLAKSRRAEHSRYPYTTDLVSDLSKARDYFQRFEPLMDERGKISMISKVRSTMRAKWDESKAEAYVSKMNIHRDNMRDFKQTVLIQAAQDNIELQISAIQLQLGRSSEAGPSQTLTAGAQDSVRAPRVLPGNTQDDTSTVSSDRMSILTRASKSLTIADRLNSTSIRRRPLTLSPVIESNVSAVATLQESSCDLRRIIAEYVEAKELYRSDVLQDTMLQELQYVAELPNRWLQLQRESGSSSFHNDPPASNRSVMASLSIPGPLLNSDSEVASNTYTIASDLSDIQDDEYILQDSVMLFTPWTKDKPIPCTSKLIQSASSLRIKSTTVQALHPSMVSTLGSGPGITPSSILSMRHSILANAGAAEMRPLVFNHAVLSGMRSFPRILHPRVELKTDHTHPYSIQFYTHQYLTLQGDNSLERAVKGVSYQFRKEEDRDFVREKIFGKKLLAWTAISTIQFARKSNTKPCGTEVISLWTTGQGGPDDLTITVQCSSQGKPEPDCAQEFTILKAKNLEKVRDSVGKELTLEISSAPDLLAEDEFASASGDSNPSDASNVSYNSEIATSPGSRRSSLFSLGRRSISSATTGARPQDTQRFHCYIKFTEGVDGLTLKKKRFLNALQASLPSSARD